MRWENDPFSMIRLKKVILQKESSPAPVSRRERCTLRFSLCIFEYLLVTNTHFAIKYLDLETMFLDQPQVEISCRSMDEWDWLNFLLVI